MKGNYKVNGSNTLYTVWGIFELIRGGIAAFSLLAMVIFVIVKGSSSSGLINMIPGLGEIASKGMVLFLLIWLIAIGFVAVQISCGIALVKKDSKSKDVFVFYAIWYFLGGAVNVISLIFTSVAASGASSMMGLGETSIFATTVTGTLLVGIIKIAWNVITGLILLNKRKKLIPIGAGDMTMAMGAAPMPAETKPITGMVECLFGPAKGQKYQVAINDECRIGRDSDNHIQVNHPKVSRCHCIVKKLSEETYIIKDVSSYGTYYDNQLLPKGKFVEVKKGGMLVLADAENVLSLN